MKKYGNQNKAEVATLKSYKRDKEGNYTMIKGSIHQEDKKL